MGIALDDDVLKRCLGLDERLVARENLVMHLAKRLLVYCWVGVWAGMGGVAGCFTPTFPQGIGCTADGRCPGEQICDVDNRCYDEPQSGDGGNVGNAALSALEVSRGTLEPAFDPSVTSYSLVLGLAAEDLVVTAPRLLKRNHRT